MNSDAFSGYHPVVVFVYFGLVLSFSMIFVHPVCLVVSFVCALAYAIRLNGGKAVRFTLFFMLPMMLFAAVLNPLFNHQGGTIVAYWPGGNPLTAEAVAYGFAAAAMLGTVVTWFSCFNRVMTSDKLTQLFGRLAPALALVFTMTLRFVPRFRSQIRVVSDAQKCIGRDASSGNILQKIKHGTHILSILVTWSLENAVQTADSMNARGYGLPGRTAFGLYRFGRRDGCALAFMTLCAVYIIAGGMSGGLYFRYFPTLEGSVNTPFALSLFAVYAALGLLPLFLNIKEDRHWKYLTSVM
jgi:energy-coupling factor transport system permease protein